MEIKINKDELILIYDVVYMEFERQLNSYKKAVRRKSDLADMYKGLIDKLCPILDTLADAREELYKQEIKNETV